MAEQTKEQGLKNFAENIRPIMRKLHDATRIGGTGKPVKLTLSEQDNILQFYLEVTYYLYS
jgi:hypothetical protein